MAGLKVGDIIKIRKVQAGQAASPASKLESQDTNAGGQSQPYFAAASRTPVDVSCIIELD